MLADLALNDCVSVTGGWGAGYDTGFSNNGGSVFIGGLSLQLTDNMSLGYTTAVGDVGYGTTTGSDTNGYSHTVLLTTQFMERFTFILQSNLLDNDTFLGSTTNIFTVNKYLLYEINDALALGARYEWIKNPGFGAGASGEATSLTFGLNVRPHANLVVRPEIRWDDYHRAANARDATIFGIDAIITY